MSEEMPDEVDTLSQLSLHLERSAGEEHPSPDVPASPPQARDHAYLPGASHPLMPESILESRKRRRSTLTKRTSSYDDLDFGLVQVPILLLPGVVVFPGTTLPLRFHDYQRRWMQYLGEKIEASRRGSSEEIVIGVLTKVIPESRQRLSWMRTGIRRGREIVNVLHEIEDLIEQEAGLRVDSNTTSSSSSDDDGSEPSDPLVGRVGCLVTIINTHGDSTADTDEWDQGTGGLWRRPIERGQLVVTALGTRRFRVAKSVIEHGAISEVPFYWVREICDEELPLPPHQPLTANPALGRHEGLIESLAKVSPMPKFVLKHMWPWRLVTEIQSSMQRIASLEGLSKSQPTKGPTAFSFWIASNMALKESEKLELLKMESTVERLRFIQAKVLALERQESFVCCRMCFTRFSAVSNLFTVGGADGTTGAYVNEYGVIHQTITLKEVDESKLLYSGRPETRESWFPGYSWTITHCRVCHSHIGWKFLHVKNHASNAVESSGRPKRFWGLSGASVTTTGPRVAPSLTRVAQENSEEATT